MDFVVLTYFPSIRALEALKYESKMENSWKA